MNMIRKLLGDIDALSRQISLSLNKHVNPCGRRPSRSHKKAGLFERHM